MSTEHHWEDESKPLADHRVIVGWDKFKAPLYYWVPFGQEVTEKIFNDVNIWRKEYGLRALPKAELESIFFETVEKGNKDE